MSEEEARIRELELRVSRAADHLVGEVMHATARAESAGQEHASSATSTVLGTVARLMRRVGRRHVRSAVERGLTFQEAGSEASTHRPSLLAFPYYPANRWQDIMYAGLVGDRAVVPLDRLDHETLESYGSEDVLHVNWTGQISQGTPDLIQSASSVRRAIGAMEEFQARGGRVLWTIHNVLPHELHHLGPELALCRDLAARADGITVMNPDTADLVADWYQLPRERLVEIPHPSYIGYFADDVSRTDARRRFGFGEDEVVLLFLGQLRPYKGLRSLTEAFRILRTYHPRLRLLVAGEPGPGFTDADRNELVREEPGRTVSIGRVPDDEMQFWCRAADLMVLPYQGALNVSLVTVAATFGIPVALRDSGTQRFLAKQEWVHLLPPNEPAFRAALERTVVRIGDDRELRARARRFAEDVAPQVIGTRFATLVDRISGDRGP